MLSNAIEKLLDAARDGVEPSKSYEDSKEIVYLVRGERVVVEKRPPSRNHKIHSLNSLNGYESDSTVVWHAGNRVVMIIDDDKRIDVDRVTWDLTPSSKFVCLDEESSEPRDHKAFVNFIVKNLRDEFERDLTGLLGVIRGLKFATNDESEGDIKHGRESMGRNVQREVLGASELPETIKLTVKRWAELNIYVEVESLLVVDLEKRTLAISPLSDSIVNANIDAHKQLGDVIRDEVGCDVYHGVY